MAIYEVTDTELVQRCAKCAADNRIELSTLVAGVSVRPMEDARVIALPVCPGCGSSEFLIQSAEDEPVHPNLGSFGHLHRLLVDEVHARLVDEGRAALSERRAPGGYGAPAGRHPPPEQMRRWFPHGLRLKMPGPQPKKEVTP